MLAPQFGFEKTGARKKNGKSCREKRKHNGTLKEQCSATGVATSADVSGKETDFCFTFWAVTTQGVKFRTRILCPEDAVMYLRLPGFFSREVRHELLMYMTERLNPLRCEYLFALFGIEVPKVVSESLVKRLRENDVH